MLALSVPFYRVLISAVLASISVGTIAQDEGDEARLSLPNASPPETVAPERAPAPQAARSGVVSLQTTVTGNQEQPQVLYILPWQSPPANEIDFELLNNQQKSVFGHVERIELRRQLEASGGLD
jgi:hypothetical protein